jgi:hypothetical protein
MANTPCSYCSSLSEQCSNYGTIYRIYIDDKIYDINLCQTHCSELSFSNVNGISTKYIKINERIREIIIFTDYNYTAYKNDKSSHFHNKNNNNCCYVKNGKQCSKQIELVKSIKISDKDILIDLCREHDDILSKKEGKYMCIVNDKLIKFTTIVNHRNEIYFYNIL